MFGRIKLIIFSALTVTGLLLLAVPAVTLADCANPATIQEQTQCGANGASGKTNPAPSDAPTKVNGIITDTINILSTVVGVVAVIMIIIGGMRYVTSGGDSNKVSSAKNTLLYAIIGLIIVALAQVIVRFVLKHTTPNG